MKASRPDFILYGAPGSGKSTQARRLVSKLKLHHLNMGGELRSIAKGRSKLSAIVRSCTGKGTLVPTEISTGIAAKFIKQAPKGSRIIFDGFPRTLVQAKALDQLLTGNGRSANFVYIELPIREAVTRLRRRATLENRPDDADKAVVTKRVTIFQKKVDPILNYYRKSGRLKLVSGVGTIPEITTKILKSLAN
jgi:adenylate kinase